MGCSWSRFITSCQTEITWTRSAHDVQLINYLERYYHEYNLELTYRKVGAKERKYCFLALGGCYVDASWLIKAFLFDLREFLNEEMEDPPQLSTRMDRGPW
jgi:hypothetical protein